MILPPPPLHAERHRVIVRVVPRQEAVQVQDLKLGVPLGNLEEIARRTEGGVVENGEPSGPKVIREREAQCEKLMCYEEDEE